MTDTNTDFHSLPLTAAMLTTIREMGYTDMTPIQAQSLPTILQGNDVLAQARTGSGKTAAFAIGILHKLVIDQYQVQALVLCPTRELADQVCHEIRRLAKAIPNTKILSLCGGKPMQAQTASLAHAPHIVVGTPGRILKHLEKDRLQLQHVTTLVLDEADRMLDMGFYEEIMQIIKHVPTGRQTLCFSATYADAIKNISRRIQRQPIDISVESVHDDSSIEQVFYEVRADQRQPLCKALLVKYQPTSTLVFCNTRQQCQQLANDFNQQGDYALALHGDLEQRERDQVLVQFSNKSCSLLIATDVAARGLDIDDLDAVINYELSPDPEVYVHRIGRTGRAGKKGLAISLFQASERFRLDAIAAFQGQPINIKTRDNASDCHDKLPTPLMSTLCIHGGRKDKLRPGDILGALTANTGLSGQQIGKINLFDKLSYVAIDRSVVKQAMEVLSSGKIKGRKYRVNRLS